jgi:hypothetical protein
MLKFFLLLSFLRPMLKFSVQTFYQPLFSHSFPFSNSFLFQKLPTPKSPKQKNQAKAQKNPSPKGPLNQKPNAKSPSPPLGVFYKQGHFINSGKQGGARG